MTNPSATMVPAEYVLRTVNARITISSSAKKLVESAEVKMNIEQTFTIYKHNILKKFEFYNERYILKFLSCRMSYKYRLPTRAFCLQQWNLLR